MTACSVERHDAQKAHSLLVFLFMADYIGVQRGAGGKVELVLANCRRPGCNSTLAFVPRGWELL